MLTDRINKSTEINVQYVPRSIPLSELENILIQQSSEVQHKCLAKEPNEIKVKFNLSSILMDGCGQQAIIYFSLGFQSTIARAFKIVRHNDKDYLFK